MPAIDSQPAPEPRWRRIVDLDRLDPEQRALAEQGAHAWPGLALHDYQEALTEGDVHTLMLRGKMVARLATGRPYPPIRVAGDPGSIDINNLDLETWRAADRGAYVLFGKSLKAHAGVLALAGGTLEPEELDALARVGRRAERNDRQRPVVADVGPPGRTCFPGPTN